MIFANALTVWYHTIIAPSGQSLWAGSLWSNMYAWVICGVIAILWGRRKFVKWDRHRKEREEERHEELKQHISKLVKK